MDMWANSAAIEHILNECWKSPGTLDKDIYWYSKIYSEILILIELSMTRLNLEAVGRLHLAPTIQILHY